jgi:hypothetical protein
LSSRGSLVKGKERTRIRRMRGIRGEKEETERKRITHSYGKRELRKRITDS